MHHLFTGARTHEYTCSMVSSHDSKERKTHRKVVHNHMCNVQCETSSDSGSGLAWLCFGKFLIISGDLTYWALVTRSVLSCSTFPPGVAGQLGRGVIRLWGKCITSEYKEDVCLWVCRCVERRCSLSWQELIYAPQFQLFTSYCLSEPHWWCPC